MGNYSARFGGGHLEKGSHAPRQVSTLQLSPYNALKTRCIIYTSLSGPWDHTSQPALNGDTFNWIPATPPAYHRQELPLAPPDCNNLSHWTTHSCSTDEGLIPQGCFDPTDIR